MEVGIEVVLESVACPTVPCTAVQETHGPPVSGRGQRDAKSTDLTWDLATWAWFVFAQSLLSCCLLTRGTFGTRWGPGFLAS